MLHALRNTAIILCALTATSASAKPAGPLALGLGAIIAVGAVHSGAPETSPLLQVPSGAK
ncbi:MULTISPECIES: hypothetical protein [Pacificibacter]|uniref:hypothetical protein n=1 Tax=Pacificibacter TaxID=1042323 RepID=UPI001C08FCD2|nr:MULTISPECIES: hypothetical protein [Pacificibacter]MBU2936494.1 hypothetical protein [Pacificibacter marinus]MDO6614704.1 hypothetical protein [Pacificibacter sp. 1_MG-2023]